MLYGILSGLFWKRGLKEIEEPLYLLEQGRTPLQGSSCSIQEFSNIAQLIQQVHKQINEQVKLSQKIVKQKAIDQEKQIQEIISRKQEIN